MKQKYVRHKTKGFFVFPDSDLVWHSQVGRFLGIDKIISAGFVRFDKNGKPSCFGESESLNISSFPEDTNDLKIQMGIL